jgi:hypothetical protein
MSQKSNTDNPTEFFSMIKFWEMAILIFFFKVLPPTEKSGTLVLQFFKHQIMRKGIACVTLRE